MDNKIKHFPRGKIRKYRVPCQISERWLQFPETASPVQSGDFMIVDVMTMNSDERERKLCELVLTKQDLIKMLEQIKTE